MSLIIANFNENLDGQSIVFYLCLVLLMLIMVMMLILKYCFYYKRHKTLFLLSLYQQTTIKNYQYFLAHGLEDQCNGMTIKQKVRKNTTNEYRYFLESSFVGVHRRFFYLSKQK